MFSRSIRRLERLICEGLEAWVNERLVGVSEGRRVLDRWPDEEEEDV